MEKRQTYSPYSIGLFVKCPKQYYFEYLDNYTSAYPNKQKIKKIQIEAGNRRELVFGELLHIILNIFFHLPEGERSQEKLTALLEEHWTGGKREARGREGGFPNLKEERQWYKEAHEILHKFYKEQDLSPQTAYLPEIEKEGEFVGANFLKAPLEEDLTASDDVLVAGKIDRIDKEKGSYHIIDYKTGRREKDDSFQLMAYAVLAEKSLGIKAQKGSYLYLRSGRLKSFEITEEEKKKTREKIAKIAQKIKAETEFPPRPTKICNWCDYLEFCPAKEEASKLIADYKGETSNDLPF